MIIIAVVRHTAPIKIRYIQLAIIVLYWMRIPRLVDQLGFRRIRG